MGAGQNLWQPQWPFLEEDEDAGGSAPQNRCEAVVVGG